MATRPPKNIRAFRLTHSFVDTGGTGFVHVESTTHWFGSIDDAGATISITVTFDDDADPDPGALDWNSDVTVERDDGGGPGSPR